LRGKQLLDVVAHPQHRHAGVGDVGQNAGGRTYSHVAAEVEFRLLDGLQDWRLNASPQASWNRRGALLV